MHQLFVITGLGDGLVKCKSWARNQDIDWNINNIDGLVQDCSNSSALALELLQSGTKPSISS